MILHHFSFLKDLRFDKVLNKVTFDDDEDGDNFVDSVLKMPPHDFWEFVFESSDCSFRIDSFSTKSLIENFSSKAPIYTHFEIDESVSSLAFRINENFNMIVSNPEDKIGYVFRRDDETITHSSYQTTLTTLVPLNQVYELSDFFEATFVNPLRIEWMKFMYKKLKNPKN